MIRRHYKKGDKWCRVIINAPDSRFKGEDRVGGLTPKSAEFEAKKASDQGMIVDIFSSDY